MKKLYVLSIVMLCIHSSAFCFLSVPKWITNLNDVFPSEKYIRAVGEGSSETLAKKVAVAELSTYFDQKVTSEIFSKSFKSQKESVYSSNSSIDQNITVSTNSELFAVQYTDVYYDRKEKKYSVCAYINKAEAFDIISQKLFSYEQIFFQKNELLEQENEDFRKILILKDSLENEDEINTLYDFLLSLNSKKAKKFDDFKLSFNEAKNLLSELKRKTPVSISSLGDYSKQIKYLISEILTQNGFIISKNADYKIISITSFDISEQNNIISCRPTISVEIEGSQEMVSSCFLVGEKKSSPNKQTVIKMTLSEAEKLLKEKLIYELLK